jgi:hypothetical protein
MARTVWLVLLFAVAVSSGFAQKGSLLASARGGYRFSGTDGEAAGSISGEIRLAGSESKADVMFVLKDVGGATVDGQNEAIVFLKSVASSRLVGSKLVVLGKGTFQGEPRDVELTLVDSHNPNVADQIRVRVIHSGRVEFDHSAKLDSGMITIRKQ